MQQPLFVRSDELAWAPRHRFYEKLNELLDGVGFDALCAALLGDPIVRPNELLDLAA